MSLSDFFFSKKNKVQPEVNKSIIRVESDADKIRGVNLKIDPSIQKLCEVYNTCSGSTRSVIYVLLVINILSFMAVMNTYPKNWTETRINAKQQLIYNDEDSLVTLRYKYIKGQDSVRKKYNNVKNKIKNAYRSNPSFVLDSLRYEKNYSLRRLRDSDNLSEQISDRNSLMRNRIDNSQHVSVPLLGNVFDIDNLALVSGISFSMLLVVVRFTLIREKNNLRIAFSSITNRYNNDFDDDLMEELEIIAEKEDREIDELKISVNLKRRRYHYNFLSMNEIFNMPRLDISKNTLQETRLGKLVSNHIFSFPFIIYMIVFINDLATWRKGIQVSFWHTIVSYVMTLAFLTFIARLCDSCNTQKKMINDQFDDFYNSNYSCNEENYLHTTDNEENISLTRQFFYSVYFIKKMYVDLIKLIPNTSPERSNNKS